MRQLLIEVTTSDHAAQVSASSKDSPAKVGPLIEPVQGKPETCVTVLRAGCWR